MRFDITKMMVLMVVIMLVLLRHCNGLSMNYYDTSCPKVNVIVRNAVTSALSTDPNPAAGLIRMHFHDCFIQGCDGSVLLDSTEENTAEKDSPVHFRSRGYDIIDNIKQQLENECPGIVSCADIVAMAARDSVFWAGGPYYEIPKGRKDGTISKIEETKNLPLQTHNSSELIKIFGQHGFTAQEMVALSGAHTIGVARCSSFKNRLKNFDSTHDVDPSIDTKFAKALAKTCKAGDNAEQPFDPSRNIFDSGYYNMIEKQAGVLSSDQILMADLRTHPIVHGYAMNQAMFFFDFQRAMVKMGTLNVKETGQVRQHCRKIN